MSKKQVATGLTGLLNPTPAETQPQTAEAAPAKIKGNYKTVCYSIPPDVAEKIKYIAYYDRKRLNAVVTEAFEQYAERWNQQAHPTEKPRKL